MLKRTNNMGKLLLIVGLFLSLYAHAMQIMHYNYEGEGIKEWQKEVGRHDLLLRLKKAVESKEKTGTIPVWLHSATCLGYTTEEQKLDFFLHEAIKRRNSLAVGYLLEGGANPLKEIEGRNALTLACDCKRVAPRVGYSAQSKCQTIVLQVEEATRAARKRQ